MRLILAFLTVMVVTKATSQTNLRNNIGLNSEVALISDQVLFPISIRYEHKLKKPKESIAFEWGYINKKTTTTEEMAVSWRGTFIETQFKHFLGKRENSGFYLSPSVGFHFLTEAVNNFNGAEYSYLHFYAVLGAAAGYRIHVKSFSINFYSKTAFMQDILFPLNIDSDNLSIGLMKLGVSLELNF